MGTGGGFGLSMDDKNTNLTSGMQFFTLTKTILPVRLSGLSGSGYRDSSCFFVISET